MNLTLDEFELYIHREISAYTKKEVARILKTEIKMLKNEKIKLKHDVSEKETLINSVTGKLKEDRVAEQM